MPDISVNRTTYIKLGNNQPITTGIAEGSMLIDRVLFAQDFLFGQFASSRFEIQIYGINNVAGQNIEVYQLENNVKTDLFVGQIESSKLDNAGYYRDIIAYDKFYFISKKNVADWFNGLWTNITEIPVLDAYKSLLAHFDIDYDPNTVTATNFSGTLHKDSVVSFEKISFKDMVKYLLEPLGLIPYINESGKGAVFSPSMANTVDLSGKYDVNQSVFEEFTVKPMQWVGIQNIDSAILQQTEITGNTSDLRYDLTYNPIRLDLYVEDGETARTAVLTNFTNKANFTEYKPCEVFMIVSDMSIKLGDKITTTRGTAYVSEIVLSGPMLVEQQLISRGSQVQQEVEEEYDPVFAYLDNRITETADDLQQQLDDFEPSEEYLEKVGEFSDTIAGGMGLQVITYKAQDGSLLKYFYAPPPAGSAVTGISGSNFIFTMKSTGFAWTNKWEGAPDASSESHVDPGTGDTVSTQWTSGISANGNAILKILNAYKISADIIDTGELVIKDQQGNIIHKFSYDDYSAVMGGPNGISYNASTGKTTIGSDVDILGSVTIGGSATIGDTITNEVNDAVEALDIKGIDHTEIKYASSASNTTAPTPERVWADSPPNVAPGNYLWTRTVIYYSDNSKSNPSYSVARQGVNGVNGTNGADGQPGKDGSDGSSSYIHIRYSANSNGYPMTTTPNKYIGVRVDTSSTASTDYTKYTWSKFEGTDGAQGLPGTNGKDGTSEYIHLAYSTVGQGETHTNANSNVSWFAGAEYLGIYHDDQESDPTTWSVYTWSRIKGEKGADGSDVDHYENAYAISTNGTQPPEDGYAVRYYWAAKYNNSGYEETMAEYFPVSTSSYYKNSSTDPYASNVGWDSTKLYLYSFIWHYTDYGNSLEGYLTDFEMCAVYNQSLPPTYPEVEQSTWQTTPPDTSQYKGQYLWTRTTVYYTSGAEVVTYSVAYIGTDGTSGRGISSTAQYYYATATDTATLPTVGTSSWKSLPSQLATPFSQSVPYLWSYTQTNYTSGNPDRTTPAIIGVWGQDGSGSGTQGRGISSITPQYALSTSNSTAPTSGWSETPPEYPSSAFTYTKSASCSISSGYSSVSLITGISIASGNTYTIKYQFSSAFSSSCTLRIYNDSGTAKQSYTIAANTESGEISYTANFNADNAEIGLEMNGSAFSYTAQIEGEPQRYYYWQRDKIVWTDGSADTYTRAVLSQGFNAAIYSANRLNTSFAEVELAGVKQVYTDAGHIYANSLTAYNVAAYEAFIKNLMANYVEVNGDILINALDPSQISTSRRDEIAKIIGFSSWNDVPSEYKLLIPQLINSKLINKSERSGIIRCSFLTDRALWFTEYNNGTLTTSRVQPYYNFFEGDTQVNGDLTVTGKADIYESGTTTFTTDTDGTIRYTNTVYFTKTYSNIPKVHLTPALDPATDNAIVYVYLTTKTYFKYYVRYLSAPTSIKDNKINYLVTP